MSTPASRSTESGFSLAEVLVALALLAAAGLSAVGLLGHLTERGVDAHDEVGAHARAVAVMESLLVHDFAELVPGTHTVAGVDGGDGTVRVSAVDARLRRLEVEVLADDRPVVLRTLVSDR